MLSLVGERQFGGYFRRPSIWARVIASQKLSPDNGGGTSYFSEAPKRGRKTGAARKLSKVSKIFLTLFDDF